MKAFLAFNLNLPDDQERYRLVNRAEEMFSALHSADNYCRDQLKYNDKLSKDAIKHLEEVRSIINECDYMEGIS